MISLFEIAFIITRIISVATFLLSLFMLIRLIFFLEKIEKIQKIYYIELYIFSLIHSTSFFFPKVKQLGITCNIQGTLNSMGSFFLLEHSSFMTFYLVKDKLKLEINEKFGLKLNVFFLIILLIFISWFYIAKNKMEIDYITYFCWIPTTSFFYLFYAIFQVVIILLVLFMVGIIFIKIISSNENCSSKIENSGKISLLIIMMISFIILSINIWMSIEYINIYKVNYTIFYFISDLIESSQSIPLLFIFQPENIFKICSNLIKVSTLVETNKTENFTILDEKEEE